MKHQRLLYAAALFTSLASLAAGGCAASPQFAGALPPGAPPAEVDAMLAEVSPGRVKANVESLVSFGTRHTLSDTESTVRGIGAARRWIKSQFENYASQSGRTGDEAMQIFFDPHHVEPDGRRITQPVDVVNVVAVLPGSMSEARHRRYYMLGHYDSRNSEANDATGDSPGANDDGSGVAALMELARVMSKRRYDATIVFVATAGEEQGLFGARGLAASARDDNLDIRGVLSNDIIGDPLGPYSASSEQGKAGRQTVRIFSAGVPRDATPQQLRGIFTYGSESDSPARQLARFIATTAAQHNLDVQPTLIFRNDRFLRGGDHLGFLEAGYPAAVRFTALHEDYDRQHQDIRIEDGVQFGDLPEFVDGDYLAEVARINAAALAHLADAPSTPGEARVIVSKLMNDTLLRWSPSPEPDVAGYEVVWRRTTSPVWRHSKDVGAVTEATIHLSKDNWIFGVRAYDRDGYRSPVTLPMPARE